MDQRISRSGFYGKLASHGDFISRRLPPDFLRTWDNWLQEGLTCSREHLGEAWQAAYLCSPIWRFTLASGVCGESAWAGILMPSVDRVGRYFPLTLAYGGPRVSPLDGLRGDSDWYEQLEALALSSLQEDFSLAAFDRALLDIREPLRSCAPSGRTAAAPAECWLELTQGQFRENALPWKDLSGRALFWTEGSPQIPPSVLVSVGLPAPSVFASLLSGRQVSA
jgi:type VI secretion system protein ImpM